MLEKMTPVDKPAETVREMHLTLEPSCISGNDVLTVEHLSKHFDDQILFQDVNFEIKRGEHVAIIGDNGTGKPRFSRYVIRLSGLTAAPLPWERKYLWDTMTRSITSCMMTKQFLMKSQHDYPSLNNTQIRSTLAAFQFTGDDVFKEIRSLSGRRKRQGFSGKAHALRGQFSHPG